ncbi:MULTISPECIES: hypothetical protein [unclassified Streptomyces]|uniref:hypothetical protein n=1 Tax=unclassified Streptomyces TaxID=2593676 RepID=UPI00136E78C9|nr:hypothetical protein [Streptomyces sp. SID4985]MYQ46216.1 hypothetical protein [Streptomyces sp. SID4985]
MNGNTLDIGDLAYDENARKVGVVMGHEGPYVQLRPPCGGREWDCPPDRARRVTAAERLSASVARTNARSRGDVL